MPTNATKWLTFTKNTQVKQSNRFISVVLTISILSYRIGFTCSSFHKTLGKRFICKRFIKKVLPGKGGNIRKQRSYSKQVWWHPDLARESWNLRYKSKLVLTEGKFTGLSHSPANQSLACSHLGRQWWLLALCLCWQRCFTSSRTPSKEDCRSGLQNCERISFCC